MHRDRAGIGLVFLGGEGAPQDGPRTEDLKPLRADPGAGYMLDLSVVQQC